MEKASITLVQVEQPFVGNITSTRRIITYDDSTEEEFKGVSDLPKNRIGEKKLQRIDQRNLIPKKSEEISEDIQVEEKPSVVDTTSIVKALKKHFLFSNLSTRQLEEIVQKMFYASASKDRVIFKQGDEATCFFIIAEGKVEVDINNKPQKELGPGEGFGDLALLYNAPRSATIKALEKTFLYGIGRATFKRVLEDMMTAQFEENRKFVYEIKFFNSMTEDQKDALATSMISLRFKKDENILSEGDLASSFYIVQEGTVGVYIDGKEIRQMGKGSSFGEQALYYNTVRSATVKALTDCRCVALSREIIVKTLGSHIQIITLRNQQLWAFGKSEVLSKLTQIQTQKIADRLQIIQHKKGDVIYKKGELLSSKIVILHEGALTSRGQPFSAVNGIIGDTGLLDNTEAEERAADDIVATAETITSQISFEDFQAIIGGPLKEVLVKNLQSHEKKMTVAIVSELRKNSAKIGLEDLIFYKKLGYGQFGSVYLVKHPEFSEFMALKCVSKQKVIENEVEVHIRQEKQIMEAVTFPFIVSLIRTFRDDNSVYFLEEYIRGMELFDVIRDMSKSDMMKFLANIIYPKDLLNKAESQFFIGQLLLCIEYLHSFNIIYRDLKPENVMIDYRGYVKLIDMGTAKYLPTKTHRTFTTIGTPHYMAPEVISGKGYGLMADLWTLGVCLYEFMCGGLPFGENAVDPQEVCEAILTKPLRFPTFMKDVQSRKIMAQLINKETEVRLGGSFAALKANPWFENFDWDALHEKQLKPPYIPPPKRLISEEDIEKMASLGHKVIDEIKKEQKSLPPYRKEKAINKNWDQIF